MPASAAGAPLPPSVTDILASQLSSALSSLRDEFARPGISIKQRQLRV